MHASRERSMLGREQEQESASIMTSVLGMELEHTSTNMSMLGRKQEWVHASRNMIGMD